MNVEASRTRRVGTSRMTDVETSRMMDEKYVEASRMMDVERSCTRVSALCT